MYLECRKSLIITNNPMVGENCWESIMLYDPAISFGGVLLLARDNIHNGRRLLTHPLSGSIKPYETPYKTVLLTEERGSLDTDSLEIIERSIETADKFYKIYKDREDRYSDRVLKDFQLIDFDLIKEFIR